MTEDRRIILCVCPHGIGTSAVIAKEVVRAISGKQFDPRETGEYEGEFRTVNEIPYKIVVRGLKPHGTGVKLEGEELDSAHLVLSDILVDESGKARDHLRVYGRKELRGVAERAAKRGAVIPGWFNAEVVPQNEIRRRVLGGLRRAPKRRLKRAA